MKINKKYLLVIIIFNQCINSFEQIILKDVKLERLIEFARLYESRPIKDNIGGMKSVGMFWVWLIIKHLNPDFIIESGIWMGQSTWLLEQSAPNAKVISIDPRLDFRKYISPQVIYYDQDFSTIYFGDISKLKSVCFFDDHQNVYERIMQANKFGFKYIIFDDNYPIGIGERSHLTLQHIFNDPKNKLYADELKKIIKEYFILPQLIGEITETTHPLQVSKVDTLNISPIDDLKIYQQDTLSYRWTTFVELK